MMSQPNTIFLLQSISVADEITVKRRCYTSTMGMYSTLEKALEVMRQEVKVDEENDWERVFGYIVEEIAIDPDKPCRSFLTLRTYNGEGELNDECLLDEDGKEPFMGRKAEDIHHKRDDLVWVLHDRYVELNIVAGLPPSPEQVARSLKSWHKNHPDCSYYFDASDDCYDLYTLGEGDTHSDIICPRVFPVTENISAALVQGLRDKLEDMFKKYM